MRKNKLWVLLSFLLVVTLVAALVAPKVTEAQREEDPKYGGTLTIWTRASMAEPPSPDERDAQFNCLPLLEVIQEMPVLGDWEKYGPKGTGEYHFDHSQYVPWKYLKGQILESWELSQEKAIWHIRSGIHWAPTKRQSAWMKARELVAEDVAADLNRFWKKAPWGNRFNGILKKVYAKDKYTVVIEFEKFSTLFMYFAGYEDRAVIAPPELFVDDRAKKWENQVGTGPFMFEEYRKGSHMSFVKNPNYWDTTTINGKKYQVPFVDRIVYPIIPDTSTQIAALATGKLDFKYWVGPPFWKQLDKRAPWLESRRYIDEGVTVGLNVTKAPFKDNLKLRRALMVGTDGTPFRRILHAETYGPHWFPAFPDSPEAYIPMEDLPEDIRILYEYDPKRAKQMLADAGYPDGLKVNFLTTPDPVSQDIASVLADQWSKIGVELVIKAMDLVTLNKYQYEPKTFQGTTASPGPTMNIVTTLMKFGKSTGWSNYSGFSDPVFDKMSSSLEATVDPEEQSVKAKELSLRLLREVLYIPLSPIIRCHYWAPWLKNYYGDKTSSDQEPIQILAKVWLDQDLKKKMGY